MTPTRPQARPESLADQVAIHRRELVQLAGLVACMPQVNRAIVDNLAARLARELAHLEQIARVHQPAKARG